MVEATTGAVNEQARIPRLRRAFPDALQTYDRLLRRCGRLQDKVAQVNALVTRTSYPLSRRFAVVSNEERTYHLERARAELDLAYRAEKMPVATAHMKLSALHMDRIKQIDALGGGSGLAGRR